MIAKTNQGFLLQYIHEENVDEFELNFDLEDTDISVFRERYRLPIKTTDKNPNY